MSGPYLDFWKLLTVLIAALVLWVQFRQFRTDRAKLKLDLFEKRFQVFAATRRLLTQVLHDPNIDLKVLFEYRSATGEASFLFAEDIASYLKQIDGRTLHLDTLHQTMEGLPRGQKRSELTREIESETLWLTDQLPELATRFGPYLSFARWR